MRPFHFDAATDPAIALRSAREPASAYLAGGTTLLDLMKLDVMRPARVVDINALHGSLGSIVASPDGLHLGALVRMAEAESHPAIRRDYPVIADTLRLAASAQIRNMASLGGNVLQRTRCNYFRDVSWDATVEVARPQGGTRTIRFSQLHRSPGDTPDRETTLEPAELIVRFFIPAGSWTRRSCYLKIRDRESYEFALAAAAVALDLDGDRVKTARIALGGVATRPWRAAEAEILLTGQILNEANAARAAKAAFRNAVAHRHNGYKIELGRRTLSRALMQAKAMEV